jgi:hypothetical protein
MAAEGLFQSWKACRQDCAKNESYDDCRLPKDEQAGYKVVSVMAPKDAYRRLLTLG